MSTTDINLAEQVVGILPVANGGTGNTSNAAASCTGNAATATSAGACSGNSATATKLATARTIQTNLASTSSASFDGSANATPGVTGTLPVANGGTGNTSGAAASCTGNAATATKLATARQIEVSLSTAAEIGTAFDGSATTTIGVFSSLQVANGGTGASTAAAALSNLGAASATGSAVGIWLGSTANLPSTGTAGILYVCTS